MSKYLKWRQWVTFLGVKPNGARKKLRRKQHNISRKNISPNALKVLYRLEKEGFSAYLVGGGVRDLLLGQSPKDFDVATNALPEQIADIFRNSRIIGRRFRLVHIYFHGEIIEVSTFRANVSDDDQEEEQPSMILATDNTYGTIEEDAWRRDFTVNSLYYNINDFAVIDYTGGIDDLEKRLIRMIGDPIQRYHEDPVRLLRAIRLSAKLKFSIHPDTKKPIYELAHLLQHVPPARLLEEILKLFFKGFALVTYKELQHYGYNEILFPYTFHAMQAHRIELNEKLILLALQEADRRYAAGLPLNPAFLFAVILWPAFQYEIEKMKKDSSKFFLLHDAINKIIREQRKSIFITRRISSMIRTIWLLQYQLMRRRPKRINQVLHHRYFRAAFDFLALRVRSGEKLGDILNWWNKYRRANDKQRKALLNRLNKVKQKND